jgi:methylation protein EvaC
MHIPVVPHETFKINPPDFSLLLAWNHAEEIMDKEVDYTRSGGRWIVHVPDVRVLL